MMLDVITSWLLTAATLLGAVTGLLAAILGAVRQLVAVLDWADDRWPALLPYTEWITDPSRRRVEIVEEPE